MLSLVIANKNYSSWSMRPWVLMSELGIPFEEILLKFESEAWRQNIERLSPSAMVPVLWEGVPGSGSATWESVAIFERLAELFPDRAIWPTDARARASARAVVAEMHASFRPMRTKMPMNIRAQHPGKGNTDDVRANIKRIEAMWRAARSQFGAPSGEGDFLYGKFSAADAMFAPVVMRFATYAPALDADSIAYCAAVKKAPGVAKWIAAALTEKEWVADDEPYASAPAA